MMTNIKANTWYSFRLPIGLYDTIDGQQFLKVQYKEFKPDIDFTIIQCDEIGHAGVISRGAYVGVAKLSK